MFRMEGMMNTLCPKGTGWMPVVLAVGALKLLEELDALESLVPAADLDWG